MCLQEANHADIDITASKTDSAHVVTVLSATTAGYGEGTYWWQAIITRDADSEEVVVDEGYLEVSFDLGGHAGDTRSWVYTTLASVRAVLGRTATKEQKAYKVAGQELERRSVSELLELEREFAQRWQKEKDDLARRLGKQVSRGKVFVKMGA